MKTIHDRYLRLISFTIIFFFFTDLYCENLNFSIKSNSQSSSLVSVSFNEGFVGDNTGNNSASNAVYLSSLGWTNIKFTQLSSSGVFVSQGNDIIGEVLITDFNGVVHSINGFIKWRSPSGNSPSTMVFSPSSSHQLITSSGFYDIDSSKYIGLTFIGEALTITGGSVSGNAATNGLLDLLNDYLTLSLSLSPSGPVTVDSITTNDQTPILTGTVILNAGEELSILVDGVEYTESSLNLSISGNSWTLEITSTLQISTYEITAIITNSDGYTLIDSSQQELEITLPDTTPPVITLTGSSTVTLEVGSSYTDLGATALDNYDGDITTEIVTDQTQVDITTLGNYTVTYNVDDSSGNSAVQVTRTVQVVDTTPPVITLTGSSTVTLEVGSSYTDLGATALDNYDGDITTEIVTDQTQVDITTLGNYTVTYNVDDSSGNSAVQVTRTVQVVDTTPPVITLTGSSTVTLEVGSSYTDLGATALDNYDGDITTEIVTDQTQVDITTLGNYTVTYNVDDSSGNSAVQVTRTVQVVDTTPPVITLTGSSTVTLEVGSSYTDLGATALDNYDGDITTEIVTDQTQVDITTLGNYTVTYNVDDSSGNSAVQVTRTVQVVDTTPPVITLTGSSTVTLEVGSSYTDLGATALDNYDGDITTEIVTDQTQVDITTLGNYTVTYNVDDSSGNSAVQVTRTVQVVDTTPPVITLTGSSTVTLEVGSSYTDLGATALDNYDGDITTEIVTDQTQVDITTLGNYTVTYNVDDSSGNSAVQVTRTVQVVDTTPPVITLTGSSTVTLEVGSSYTDLGATALDNYDGDITTEIVTDQTQVDITTLGNYTVTYNVDDSSGNSAVQVTRTVQVVDTTPPVITLTGSSTVTLEVGSSYTDLGATALDNYDGDITTEIVTDQTQVDITTLGNYTVTYNVDDSSGNSAVQVTRTVQVVDTTPPVITLTGSSTVTLEVGSSYTDLGATALDNYDGDITTEIVTDQTQVDITTLGNYTVTYNVDDSSGNSAVQVTRTVQVVDTTPPVITLTGSSTVTLEVGSSYTDLGATALDNYDGDITTEIVTDQTQVDITTLGNYTVTYNVDDSSGNSAVQVTRTVQVVDTTPPVITLTGSSTVTLEVGSSYTDLGATALDNYDGDITTEIVTDQTQVDITTLGNYTVTYNVDDSSGNSAVQVTRTVQVVDTTPPVITLTGSSTVTLEVGSSYTDLGATALDNYDGDITTEIVTDQTQVDITTLGNYTVTYNVDDSSGNSAVQVTRTVQVVDTTPPVITLTGSSTVTLEVGSSYTDLGATALDNYDGDITTEIVTDQTQVDITTLGNYTVTYNVDDSSGNSAVQVTRTVQVVDTTPPVITLTGSSTVTLEVGSSYTDLGATALDNYDGDITTEIVTDQTQVDITTLGNYTVTYNVDDSSGNSAVQVTRTVQVVDTTPPVITLTGSSTVTLEVGSSYTDLGATALDNYDGDITTEIVTDQTQVDITTLGNYTVTYNVDDSSGNSAVQVTRTVQVVDTTPPVITLTGSSTVTLEVGSSYTDLGATALDNYDGDITTEIVTDQTQVDITTLGNYTVTYNVDDSSGNSAVQVTRTVQVVDTTPPVITLTGSSTVTLEVGSSYTDLGATALDNYDGDITTEIVTDQTQVDITTLGNYTVTYNVDDSSGNSAVQVTRTVQVVDTTPPVITLTGSSTVTLEVGSSYTDLGATALDNYDGDITTEIVTDQTQVDITTLGNYTVTYNVDDSSGNSAVQVTRTVQVVDTTPPVITLTGSSTVTLEVGSSYTDLGATALDNYDGDITTEISLEGGSLTIDTCILGTYTIKYNVVDSSGNIADEVVRNITIFGLDSDNDGIGDVCDNDDDGDGIDDVNQDCDNDGITNSLDNDNSNCSERILMERSYGFSPNGDGINDTWVIQDIDLFPKNVVRVFSRSGKLVFKKNYYKNDWDGVSNQISAMGIKLPAGPYVYIIDLGDNFKPIRGWIYINF